MTSTWKPLTIGDGVIGAEDGTAEELEAQRKRAEQATPEMKEFALRMYLRADEIIARALGTAPLQEAFNPDQARYPKGHPKAGQWRPKLSTGAGRIAPGHLANDLFHLTEDIKSATGAYGGNVPVDRLNDIGKQVEKVALRYSARKHYEKRLEDVRKERRQIQDRRWEAWEKAWAGMTPEQKKTGSDPDDFLEPGGRKRLAEIADEEIRLTRDRDRADRDAMLGVLEKIRPMGGTLKQAGSAGYAVDQASGIERQYIEAGKLYLGPHSSASAIARQAMKDDLDKSLKEILKVVPKAWLDDTNGKGEVSWLFSKDRAYADTRPAAAGETDEFSGARTEFANLGEQGYKFLGTLHKYPTFLMFREPDTGDVIALHQDGHLVKGVGDYEDTPLVLDVNGEMGLPGYATRPTAAQARKLIEPMENLPPPRIESGSGGAMGPNWDPYKEMREGVERYEREGWTFVGQRGKWATLRKDGEEVSLSWAGKPLTGQVGDGGKTDPLPPLNPYGQVPLPPIPVRHDTIIKIEPSNRPTLLHELSHRLEVVYGTANKAGHNPIAMATHAWRDERTRGQVLQSLQLLYPGYAYEEHEHAWPDRFVDAYIGKAYASESTEVLTMGMEMLWFPRYGERDINKDPEMRQFILGVMATL